ncbi:MAG: ferrous iron transport protein B [Bacillota bacterium]|nr:ferrous iron transport protein B [Bacillota bacterium]MDW7683450.1 ferrous iron transport protein B [Bacillota bacterium]
MSTHCHNVAEKIEIPADKRGIVLVGNPNVGKSVFFNALTGRYVDVSNFPGTTVEIHKAPYGDDLLLDTPGVYGVSSFNDEERVARDIILNADTVINIVDALHMERDLFLTQQIIDMGIPTVVALNMMDEAEESGVQIDVAKLSRHLGVPVIPTVATKNKGITELKAAVGKAAVGNADPLLTSKLDAMTADGMGRGDALLVLEGDEEVALCHGEKPGTQREEIYLRRRHRVNEIITDVVQAKSLHKKWNKLLGQWAVRPLTGIPMVLGLLYAMYLFIGVFVAQTIVGITEETIMIEMYGEFITSQIFNFIPEGSFIGELLAGEFGMLTMAPIYLLGLLLPLVVGFYLALSVMEDSGYLPRLATLVDRTLTGLGLNGRAIIPMILGFGCVTMATITTRLLGSKRERLIATVLLGITIPCSAQIGVIAGLIAPLGINFLIIYVVTIFIVFILTGTLLNKVLPGESTHLLIDLPPLRLPRIKNVFSKTYTKSVGFMKEAAPLFVLAAVVITVLNFTGGLAWLQDVIAPLTVGWLRLPPETTTAFIMGIMRRDFGAAGLYGMDLTAAQTLVGLVTITLFVPCIATIMVMVKERGWKDGTYIWVGSLVTAFVVGGILARIIV